jgi:hypothetical protein
MVVNFLMDVVQIPLLLTPNQTCEDQQEGVTGSKEGCATGAERLLRVVGDIE